LTRGLSPEDIARAQDFHGHMCPGLTIGLRAAEYARRELGLTAGGVPDEEVVAVVETDMCAVDALQALLGCTFGKGNLIHRDHGKVAFSFYRRKDGKAFRLLFAPPGDPDDEERAELKRRAQAVGLDDQARARSEALRAARIQALLAAPLESLFELQPAAGPVPARARLLESVVCEACGETVMETRARLFLGQTLCLPCFEERERR
jgi:formylmethanofuran dehydrogenase subunit E